jgi:hypothetical protein
MGKNESKNNFTAYKYPRLGYNFILSKDLLLKNQSNPRINGRIEQVSKQIVHSLKKIFFFLFHSK